MIWTREQAKALTDRALSFSKAEEHDRHPERGRSREPEIRAQHRNDVRRKLGLQPGHRIRLRQAVRHRDDR